MQEVLEFIPVPMSSNIGVMKPFFSTAERNLILLIGKEQFDELVLEYNKTTQGEEFKEAIEHAQRMIVNQGYFFAVPVLSVNISSAGILINSNENTKQAFPWQVEKVEKSLLELSFTAIEDLLEYLESDESTFAKYIASEPYKSQQRFFIKTALEFSRHFDIANSRYLYSTIAYIMKRVEDQELELAFNAPFVEFMRENESDPEIKHLLTRFINPGIALITAAKALRERIIVTRNGIATINLSGNYNAIKKNFPQDKQKTIQFS